MTVYRAPSGQVAPQTSARPTSCWWYTLAHVETPPARLSVTPAALDDFSDALVSCGEVAAAARIAKIAREVARGDGGDQGERYVWGFRRLGDALAALRANHRSDYHAYPHPQSIYEASLDRLYQRFPLTDYPRTTALLFSGSLVCEDPRLWANPRADALAAVAPEVIAPDEWGRYTLCGFRQGLALVRVSANGRWLRIDARALEDTWAQARRDAEAPAVQRGVSVLKTAESLAREALLRSTQEGAFIHPDDPSDEPAAYGAAHKHGRPAREERPQPLRSTAHRRQSTSSRQQAG